ncbi:MAG TPA: SDR family NAD(P)-dependent oxidoreductase [Verrucomicrobiae bacterium]|nr:SDR family NAD(P)-dependent oxidoreductase [Verrucomicrobiae bacterium]
MSDGLRGRPALVTGAASGIGAASWTALRDAGARVVGLDRRFGTAGGPPAGPDRLACDVADEAQVTAAVELACARLEGPPELLVNAAGIYPVAPIDQTSGADFDRALAVNLRGPFLLGRAVARAAVGVHRPASIVNLTSVAAEIADRREPSCGYAASKAGVAALTRQMAAEWASHQIRVNAVAPGVIDTPMLRLMDDPQAGARFLAEAVPLARLGRAEEVAQVILFLLSERASYVTGTVVTVDGGLSIL